VAKVCISTIQRLYSMLRGVELDPDVDEQSGDTLENAAAPARPEAYTDNNARGKPMQQRPSRQRFSCAPGMFNSLEVQVLYPT
jgi:hypothetical protein